MLININDLMYGLVVIYTILIWRNVYSEQLNTISNHYDNYRIYELHPATMRVLILIREIELTSGSMIRLLDAAYSVKKFVRVLVAPLKLSGFIKFLQEQQIEYKLLLGNIQEFLNENFDSTQVAELNSGRYDWNKYYQLDDTYEWLKYICQEYRHVVKLLKVGRTYENRTIFGIKISKSRTSKPAIFIEAGIHAREWIASSTATFLINQLLISNDPGIVHIAENYNWYIVPHANPDGYVYSHNKDRLWRKTRTPYAGGCVGADPNRNWSFQWKRIGASGSACAETYAGPKPFSEIETRTMAKFIRTLRNQIKLFISFHSFSQLILYPYAHTSQLADNYKDLKQVMNATITAIRQRYGTRYTGGNTYNAIYPASGCTIDWVYAKLGVKMTFLFELRPRGNDLFGLGFVLPANKIIPTAEETLDGIIAMVNEVEKLGYFNSNLK